MRIALVSPYDYPYPGGVTEHIAALAAGLERRGHRVRILSPASSGGERLAGDRVYRLGSVVRVPYHGSLARITLSLGLGGKVRAILERERFDVVHLHEPLLPTLPLTVLALTRTATVGTFHAYWDRSLFYALGRPLLRRAFARLDARVAVSAAAERYVGRYFPGAYTRIPNGVDTTRFRPDLEPLPAAAGAGPSVLFVGRLEPRKGFMYLLRAFALLSRSLPEARLLVAGAYSADEHRRYAQLAAALGVGRVAFLGRLDPDELARCYASAAVCCAPSLGGESFGIVLLEAMASGRPVVCSDIPGYHEVVQPEHQGLLVPPADPPALAAALLRLLGDPVLRERLGAAGRRRAADFDWERVTARVEAIYAVALVAHAERLAGRTPTGGYPVACRGTDAAPVPAG